MFQPTTFGKYFLLDKIATGGMAEIYRGKLLGPAGFEKQLVIKQIHPKYVARKDLVDMFVAEAKITVSFTHGNIVPIYELGVVDGTYFIAMEYVDGVTLWELWRAARKRRRRLGAPIAAYLCAEILKGLDYAHRKGPGVIHRDLSPRNVMVSREGEVKLLDFGLAATLETAAEKSRASSGGGRPVGSFPYMSPEQARRAPLDPRSDLFSAGILLWELLTGESLFARPDEDATLEAVKHAPIAPPSSKASDVPPELDAVCLRSLEREPDRRFRTAAEQLQALSRWLYGLEPQVTAATLSALVAELCPDVPRRSPTDHDLPALQAGALAEGGGTRPMSKRPVEERSFATHVELEKALERNRTPLLPFRALEGPATVPVADAPRPAPTPAPRTPPREPAAEPAVTARTPRAPAPSSRARLLVVGGGVAAALAVAAVLVVRAQRPGAAIAAAADAGPGTAAIRPPPADAAPPPDADEAGGSVAAAEPGAALAAGEPDAAPRVVAPIRRPTGTGTLIVGLENVNWATVYVDGRKLGDAPQRWTISAGPHKVRVECAPAVCPPDGRSRTFEIDVPAGGEVRRTIAF